MVCRLQNVLSYGRFKDRFDIRAQGQASNAGSASAVLRVARDLHAEFKLKMPFNFLNLDGRILDNMTNKTTSLNIDPELRSRLTSLAARSGTSFADLAESVLRTHADEQERMMDELAEDEERWQRYVAGGQTIPFETVRSHLHGLAAQAAQAEPQ